MWVKVRAEAPGFPRLRQGFRQANFTLQSCLALTPYGRGENRIRMRRVSSPLPQGEGLGVRAESATNCKAPANLA